MNRTLRWKLVTSLLLMFGMLIALSGCSAKTVLTDQGEQEGLLLFLSGMSDINKGELYYKKGTNDKEKISSDAVKNQYVMMPTKQAVLYLESDGTLYLKELNKNKQKISGKVIKSSFKYNKSEDTILFLKENESDKNLAELYVQKIGLDKEKIASDLKYGVSSKEIQMSDDGNTIFFVNKDQTLYKKEANKEREKLSSEVLTVSINGLGTAYAYKNKSGAEYIKWANDIEPQKIASGSAQNVQMLDSGLGACFLGEYNSTKQIGELFFVSKGVAPFKIASDVKNFKLSVDGSILTYLNEDKTCYVKEIPKINEKTYENSQKFRDDLTKTEKIKIGSDINHYDLEPYGTASAFINMDANLYHKRSNSEKVRLGTDIIESKIYQSSVLFLNKDRQLAYNKELDGEEALSNSNVILGENVAKFLTSDYGKYIVYHDQQEKNIMMSVEYAEPKSILDKVENFELIHYNNQLVYEKTLKYESVIGHFYNEKLKQVYSFNKDMNLVLYDQGTQKVNTKIEQTASDVISITFKSVTPSSMINQSQHKIIYTKDQKFKLQVGSTVYDLKAITEEEKKTTLAKLKKEAEDKAAQLAREAERLARVEAAHDLGAELLAYGAYIDNYQLLFEKHSFNSFNYGSYNNGGYHDVYDYWVSDNGDLWINTYANNYDYGHIYVWSYYITPNSN